jgi:hypothetical protein
VCELGGFRGFRIGRAVNHVNDHYTRFALCQSR